MRLVTPAARTTQWRERLIPVTAIAPPPSPRSSSGSHPQAVIRRYLVVRLDQVVV
jgi:hypothetical protein